MTETFECENSRFKWKLTFLEILSQSKNFSEVKKVINNKLVRKSIKTDQNIFFFISNEGKKHLSHPSKKIIRDLKSSEGLNRDIRPQMVKVIFTNCRQ